MIAELSPARYRIGAANPEFSTLFVFYMDWGMIGLVLMAGWGVLFRFVYEALRRHPESPTVRIVFALSIPFVFIAMRDSPIDTFQRVVSS